MFNKIDFIDLSDLLGVPFVDGGRDKQIGFDCWGLVLEVYRRFGIKLNDYKIGCMEASEINNEIDCNRAYWNKLDRSEIKAPCLVVIKFNSHYCNHTGVYIGGGRFIHTRTKIGVNIDRIDSPAWRLNIEGFYTPATGVVIEE